MTDHAAAIAESAAVLERLEADAERLAGASQSEAAAAVAQVAAHFAWFNHPGRYVSPRLEAVLRGLSGSLEPVGNAVGSPPQRVLHVLTQAYSTGGHTRYARRWAEWDTAHAHAFALTNQRGGGIPEGLMRYDVRSLEGPMLTRAARLRQLASRADLVVSFAHPYDVVPMLAFAAWEGRPSVIVADHVDHAFWLGASIADVVACHRAEGRRVATERRGIEARRCVDLPIPADDSRPFSPAAKSEARAALGIAEDAKVLLTVGDAYKYLTDGPGIVEVLAPVLDADPDALLIAVGPQSDGMWASHPQVVAVGRVPSLEGFWAAADVYLDSWPCSGATSAMEMAVRGVPVVQFCPDPEAERFYYPDEIGPPSRCHTVETYRARIEALLVNPSLRAGLGRQLAIAARARHGKKGWLKALGKVYAAAISVGPAPMLAAVPEPSPTDTADGFLVDLDAALSRFSGLGGAIAEHGHLIPAGTHWNSVTSAMSASVVIPAWNAAEQTQACLDSVLPTLRDVDRVVVVDNGSTDTTPQMLRNYGWPVSVLTNPENRGFAAANNQGADFTDSDVVVFLNSDTIVHEGWLDALCLPFADETVGAVGPLGTNVSGPQGILAPNWEAVQVGRLVGFCLAVRRSALDEVSGWDEEFTGGYEDDWLCHRLSARGWRLVITSQTIVEHVGHASFDANEVDWYARQESNRPLWEARRHEDIAMVAIVRDEAAVIERLLTSAAQVCGRAVVVDTGSVDKTPEIVEKVCADLGLALTLEHRPWTDFATNRTEALRIGQESGAGWLLLLDAEQTLEVTGPLPNLCGDAYQVAMSVGGLYYTNAKLVRARRGWQFIGAAHEYLHTLDGEAYQAQPLGPCLTVVDHLDSGDRMAKIARNRVLLEADLERDPDNPRTVFYLGETYRDLGDREAAKAMYKRRALMEGTFEEEGWYAHWQWGSLVSEDDLDTASVILTHAFERRPHRAEPLWDLGRHYRFAKRYQAAYMVLSHAITLPLPPDTLFVHAAVYDHLIAFELAIAAWWTGRYAESDGRNRELLARDALPSNIREAVERNLAIPHP